MKSVFISSIFVKSCLLATLLIGFATNAAAEWGEADVNIVNNSDKEIVLFNKAENYIHMSTNQNIYIKPGETYKLNMVFLRSSSQADEQRDKNVIYEIYYKERGERRIGFVTLSKYFGPSVDPDCRAGFLADNLKIKKVGEQQDLGKIEIYVTKQEPLSKCYHYKD